MVKQCQAVKLLIYDQLADRKTDVSTTILAKHIELAIVLIIICIVLRLGVWCEDKAKNKIIK
jgi:hypothetical protein